MRPKKDCLKDGIDYKSRFELPVAEADFVCALAKLLGVKPDEALAALIRLFAKENREVARDIWHRAASDGRGPW